MTSAEAFAIWAARWTPRLSHLYDAERASRDSSYDQNWLVVVATPEADADLDRLMRTARPA